ncbi:signal transduction histidine kinase [Marinilabilia salmonicolor]|jgi:signal transduction histidine kinase/ligand-binding sensor domain-containing protein/CheY-like chemotaxis protein/AraC-like DNA-binding protein|uniref:hybrid sensor histidine kinase/response regulator transcription factor n=1 Tax=Marinilabilia salmonicolor TaxID=989 RepID=UPI000D06616A|nr:hybrid sensor histidine kinase/response regulator transcription factor [Marinilabilia salmonicolor]PRZ01690.1 signal transduction histidine kinase [Marinilabilia salmonicolor]
MTRKNPIFILLIFFAPLWGAANPQSVRFKNLNVEDGLSSNWVKCFLEDSRGFLWIGTSDGLNRYNGYQFETYKYSSDSIESLNDNNINVIFEDRNKKLWVGTHWGINLYLRDQNRFMSIPGLENYVSDIFELPNGELLIGSPGGLYLLNPKSLSVLQINPRLKIEKISGDSYGNIFIAGAHGACLFKASEIPNALFKPPDDETSLLSGCFINSMLIDSHDRIWLGTSSYGLTLLIPDSTHTRFSSQRFQHDRNVPSSLSKGAILSIEEGPDGNIWVGLENGGLNILTPPDKKNDQPVVEHFTHSPVDKRSLSFNSIHALYKDSKGIMWLGLYSNGVDFYHQNLFQFSHYYSLPGVQNSLTSNSVNTFLELENEILIGTENGLNTLNKQSGDIGLYLPETEDQDRQIVWSLLRDKKGRIWIGTWDNGIIVYDPETGEKRNFRHDPDNPHSLGNNHVFGIIEDSRGTIWVACLGGGLNRYSPEKQNFKRYQFGNPVNSISNDWVVTLMESSNEEIWISTTRGLNVLNLKTNRFHTFWHAQDNPASISSDNAICLFEDSKKNIWIGTKNGLNLFIRKDSSFMRYGTNHGLSDNTINAIREDESGNLWVSSKKGLSRIVNGISCPKSPVIQNFDIHDGLQGLEFNRRSALRTKDGRLFFGGMNGFNVFDPQDIRTETHHPPVAFSDFLLFNKTAEIGTPNAPLEKHINECRKVELQHDQSVFTIKFASPEYLHPQKVKYAYQLKGFDAQWTEADQSRSATYTNLNAGEYTFLVAGTTGTDFNYNTAASVSIIIHPPWWLSLPAKILYVILIVLTLYFFRRYTIISVNMKNKLWLDHLQKEKEEELTQMKLQFFTNISHELRTPLTIILNPLIKLKEKWNNSPELQIIHHNFLKINRLVDQILNFRRIESGAMPVSKTPFDVICTVKATADNFAYQARAAKIDLFFQTTHSKLLIIHDQEKIDLILTNLISNAIKFTPKKGEIYIETALNTDTLILKVTDTGTGIPEPEMQKIFDRFYSAGKANSSSGIGLNLVKRVTELLNGTVTVESRPGQGSSFTIRLPLSENEILEASPGSSLTMISKINLPDSSQQIAAPSENITVMVVDDDPEICDTIRESLKDWFYVTTECDAKEGIKRIKSVVPDLVISDVMMPDINGYELCEKIKTDLRTSHIPVILLTADSSRTGRLEGFETGADDYLCKPFEADILISRIRNLIKQRERLKHQLIRQDLTINPESKIRESERRFLQQVLDIIKDHFEDPEFNAYAVIEQSGMSRSVFYKKFKAVSNQSVSELIKQNRLRRASQLLSEGKLSVSEVAYVCGFSDPSYFNRVFKEEFQVTPGEFVSKPN